MPAADKLTFKQRTWHITRRLLRSLGLIYLLVGIGMFAFQTKLIFPGAAYQGSPETLVKPAIDEDLVHLQTADGTQVVGLFCHADLPLPRTGQPAPEPGGATPLPTILFFYGNAMCVNDATYVGDKFRALGYHVMLVDYEGYGMSAGKPSEQGCYNAAEAAYQHILTRPDVDTKRIIASGWSLGSAVAIELAHRHRADNHICALMTFSALTSMVDVGSHHYPFLPVGLVLTHRFDAIDKIKDLSIPFFAAHGKHDSIIPFQCTPRLINAYGGKPENVTFLECDTDHNDFFDDENRDLLPRARDFLEKVTR